MNKIIRIDPAQDVFSISWIMHLRCNYDCMYCPPDRHQEGAAMHDLAHLQQYWQQIFEKTKQQKKQYKFSFTGGEVTVNRDFLPFVQWMRQEYGPYIHTMGMTTNGSASLNYYLRAFQHLDYICFSTHTEHMDEDRFWATALELSRHARRTPGRSFMVCIMEEYWATEQIARWQNYCQANDIFYSLNPVLWEHKTRDYPIFRIQRETTDA